MMSRKASRYLSIFKLPPKSNWNPAVKKGTTSILVSDGDPPVLLYHLAVSVVHAMMAYGLFITVDVYQTWATVGSELLIKIH
jgi:hypothetical protein